MQIISHEITQLDEFRIMSSIFHSIYLIYTTSQTNNIYYTCFRRLSSHIVYEVDNLFDLYVSGKMALDILSGKKI